MKCPACAERLVEKKVGDVVVDVCEQGCVGVWFDNYELSKMDALHESQGEVLLESLPKRKAPVDHLQKRQCPRCDNVVMMRHFYSIQKEVEIDKCPSCNGIWLDAGELAAIRSQFKTDAERHQAAKSHFQDLFGGQLQEKAAKSTQDLDAKRDFAKTLRYVLPSYWIPGNQKGGAF